MRRAVILVTLTCMLFAVAGVTVAGENTFNPGWQGGDQTESTVPESTVAGRTAPEATAPRLQFLRQPYPRKLNRRSRGP